MTLLLEMKMRGLSIFMLRGAGIVFSLHLTSRKLQRWVPSRMCIWGVALEFEGVRAGRKVREPKALQTSECLWVHSLRKFFNLRSWKCHFLRFHKEIFSK